MDVPVAEGEIMSEARRLLAEGRLGEAAELLESHLRKTPGDVYALRALGRSRLRQGRVAEAAQLLSESLGVGPGVAGATEDLPRRIEHGDASGDGCLPEAADDEILALVEEESRSIRSRRTYFDRASDAAAGEAPSAGAGRRESYWDDPRWRDGDEQVALVAEADGDADGPDFEVEFEDAGADDAIDPSGATEAAWFETVPRPVVEPDEVGWDSADVELEEFEEQPTPEELQREVATGGGVSVRVRALQMALALGGRWSWDPRGIGILRGILEDSPWGATCSALDRVIAGGATPEELNLASDLRRLWTGCEHYATNLRGHPHVCLTWPLALKTIRTFRGRPDVEELDHFLAAAYEGWYGDVEHRERYSSFRDYLNAVVTGEGFDGLVSPEVAVDFDVEPWDDGFEGGRYEGFNTPRRQALEELGFVVDGPRLPG